MPINSPNPDSTGPDIWLEHSGRKVGFRLAKDENGTLGHHPGVAPDLAPQVRQDAFGYQHEDPRINVTIAFENWHRGAGFDSQIGTEEISDEDANSLASHAYNFAEGIDTSWENKLYLSPKVIDEIAADVSALAFTDAPLGVFFPGRDDDSRKISFWLTAHPSAAISTGTVLSAGEAFTGPVVPFQKVDGTNVYVIPAGDSRGYVYSSTGTSWATSTADDPSAYLFAVRGESSSRPVLWKTDSKGVLKNATDPSAIGASWSAGAALGPGHETVGSFLVANDKLYLFRSGGIYEYDGTDTQDVWLGGRAMPHADNGKHATLAPDGTIYVTYGGSLFRFDPIAFANGGVAIAQVWPSKPVLGNTNVNGAVTAIAVDSRWLYFALYFTGTEFVAKGRIYKMNLATGEIHSFINLGNRKVWALGVIASHATGPHTENPTLVISASTSLVTSQDTRYAILPREGLRPGDDDNVLFDRGVTQQPGQSGHNPVIVGSWVDIGSQTFSKFLNGARIVTANSNTARNATLKYEVDNEAAVTLLTANGPSIDTTAVTSDVEFNRIRYRLEMASGTEEQSPEVDGFTFGVTPNPPRKRLWQVSVLVGPQQSTVSGDALPDQGRSVEEFLFNGLSKRVIFYDRYGRSFITRLLDIQAFGLRPLGRGDSTGFTLSLAELAESEPSTAQQFLLDQDALNSGKVLA